MFARSLWEWRKIGCSALTVLLFGKGVWFALGQMRQQSVEAPYVSRRMRNRADAAYSRASE
jgi:hypothetical protein